MTTTIPTVRRLGVALVCAASVATLSCVGATRYRPHKGWKGGYADARLNDDTFKVSFAANSFTARTTAEAYLMYRCAELVVQAGYGHFTIVETAGGWTPWNPESRPSAPPAWVSPALQEHARHHVPDYSAVIRALREPSPGSYDARQLLRYLAPTIRK